MCRLSFFASNIADVATQIDSRADSLQDLHSKGFRDTHKACQCLGRDIGYLSVPLVEQPVENLFWVNSVPLVSDMVTVLRAEAAKIRSNLEGNRVSEELVGETPVTVSTRQYVEFLINETRAAQALARKTEEDARKTVSLRRQMDDLLAEAVLNLESEPSTYSTSEESE